MTDRYIRQSWVHSHKVCPRGSLFGYGLDGTGYMHTPNDSKPATGQRDVGTVAHFGIEALNKGEDPLAAIAAKKKEHQMMTAALFPWPKEWDDVYKLAHIMVEGYVQWLGETSANAGERTLGVEVPFEMEVPGLVLGDRVFITGKIDHLVEDTFTGEVIVEDTKTVQSLDQAVETLQVDDQGVNYCILATNALGRPVQRFRHNMLRKVKRTANAKPPFYGRHAVRYNTRQLDNGWRHLYRTVTDIVAQLQAVEADRDNVHDWPQIPSKDCSWRCDFKHICPNVDNGVDWHGMIATSGLYVPRNGNG